MEEIKKAKKAEKAKYDIAYAKSNIKRVPLDMQKADYEALKAVAIAKGERVNEYIKKAIWERIERDIDLGEFPFESKAKFFDLFCVRPKDGAGGCSGNQEAPSQE